MLHVAFALYMSAKSSSWALTCCVFIVLVFKISFQTLQRSVFVVRVCKSGSKLAVEVNTCYSYVLFGNPQIELDPQTYKRNQRVILYWSVQYPVIPLLCRGFLWTVVDCLL